MKYIAPLFFVAAMFCTSQAIAHPHDTPQQPQAQPYILMRQPCLLRPFARARYNRMFVPRAIAVPVQPVRWIPGRWVPMNE